MNRYLSIIAVALTLTGASLAQRVEYAPTNYFNVNIGAGLGTILCNPMGGHQSMEAGALGQFQYIHYFSSQWGAGIGAQFSVNRSHTTYNFTDATPLLVHPDNDWYYESRAIYTDWVEHQKLFALGIPVQLYFRTLVGREWLLNFGVGALVDFNIGSSFETQGGDYETRGYFYNTATEYAELSEYGFCHHQDKESGKMNPSKINVSALVDFGIYRNLTYSCELYLGLYATYGLSNIYQSNSQQLMTPVSSGVQPQYNGTFESNQITRANTLSAGLKVGLSFGKKGDPYHARSRYKAAPGEETDIPVDAQFYREQASNYAAAAADYARKSNLESARQAAQEAQEASMESINAANQGNYVAAYRALQRTKAASERARYAVR